MITCKEDLVGFYALREDKEVFELFMDKCEEFGVTWSGLSTPREINDGAAVSFGAVTHSCLGYGSEEFYINQSLKKLTISDFKPTRTEYVKVTDSIFDLKAEFEAGELYYSEFSMGKKFVLIGKSGEHLLMGNLSSGNLYRKVEREITWQDEVYSHFLKTKKIGIECSIEEAVEMDCYHAEFIEMCHKVYHLTK